VEKTHSAIKCLFCTKIFEIKADLINHLLTHETHEDLNNFQCDQCTRACRTRKSLYFHKRKKHPPNRYQCHHCFSIMKTKHKMKKHLYCHFQIPQNLADADEYVESKNYQCVQCSEYFAKKTGLEYHNKCKHSIETFKCLYCSKTFKYKPHLVRHQKNHLKSKN
jgi:KRAB domain-containing zinc finger protein